MSGWIRACARNNCVELKALDNGLIALRNSADPYGRSLRFTRREIQEFCEAWGRGEFRDLLDGE